VTSVDRPLLLVVQHEDDGGLGRFRPVLAGVAELDVRRPDTGDALPDGLAGYDGLAVLGGSMDAWDDEAAPWLPATRRLLAEGVERGVPTIGICLGHQLLALATGGRVERGDRGLEVGVVPVELLPAAASDAFLGPVVRAVGSAPRVPQFHQDAVVELPPGAVPLARGEAYSHQAFRLGDAAWGLQYHAEVTVADWARWLRDGHGTVTAAGLDVAAVDLTYSEALPTLDGLAAAHSRSFGRLLVAAAGRGATDLAS